MRSENGDNSLPVNIIYLNEGASTQTTATDLF
jgi:hypothetical protein